MSEQIDGLFITFNPGESQQIEKSLIARGFSLDAAGIKNYLVQSLKKNPRSSVDRVIEDLQKKVLEDPQAVYEVLDSVTDTAINFIGNLISKKKKPRE